MHCLPDLKIHVLQNGAFSACDLVLPDGQVHDSSGICLQERKRTAQLLSQLPADIDIAMLLQPESATIAASIKKGKKGIAPAGSSVMLSSLRG